MGIYISALSVKTTPPKVMCQVPNFVAFPPISKLEEMLDAEATERPLRVVKISLEDLSKASSFFMSIIGPLWKLSSLHIYVIVTNLANPPKVCPNALKNIALFASQTFGASLNPLVNLDIRLSQNSFSGQESFFDQYSIFNPAIFMGLMTILLFLFFIAFILFFILQIRAPTYYGSMVRKKNQ